MSIPSPIVYFKKYDNYPDIGGGRIEQLLQDTQAQQAELFALADDIGLMLETAAQHYRRLVVHKMAQPVDSTAQATDYHRVDSNRVDAIEARSIGAETVALHVMDQWHLTQKLTALGFNGVDRAAALGSILGRMVSPGSELHTHEWLQSHTALRELLDHNFGSTSLTRNAVKLSLTGTAVWVWV